MLFSLLLENLTFVLGGYEYRATQQTGVAYTEMASLVVPVVLVAGLYRVNRIGAATGIVLLLMLWRELMRAALLITDYVLPSFLPLWPLYVIPAAVVDGWLWLVRRHPQAAWHDAVAGLLLAQVFVGLLLTAPLAGITGAASGWAGAQLYRRLLTARPAATCHPAGAPQCCGRRDGDAWRCPRGSPS